MIEPSTGPNAPRCSPPPRRKYPMARPPTSRISASAAPPRAAPIRKVGSRVVTVTGRSSEGTRPSPPLGASRHGQDHQRRVMASEPERVRHRRLLFDLSRLHRDNVDRDGRLALLVVGGGWYRR